MYEIKFKADGEISVKAEKRSRAKIVDEALKAAGLETTVTVNKTVDFTVKPKAEPKPKTEKKK